MADRPEAESAELILMAAQRYRAERAGQEPQFTKHAASWLNAEAYLDEADSDPEQDSLSAFLADAEQNTQEMMGGAR